MKSYKALELVTSAPQESESRAVAASTKKSLAVDLAGAGAVEISIDVDLLRLNKDDREFVFDLIDKVRAYRHDQKRQEDRDVELNDDRTVAFRGDQEMPF